MLARCSRLVARRQVQAALQSTETALTANRERFRLEKENGSFLVKGTGKNATFFNESHSVHNFPGSRFVELTRHLSGNPFTGLVLKKLANDFLLLEENDAVGTVIFGTNVECGESFSTGFCEKSLQINRNQTLQGLYTLARLFSTYKKDFVSVSGSKMPGTVLGLNLNAKYRLGVPSLECTVTELTRGYVPAGGLAYHFSRKADAAGLIMARYLAYSLRTIQAVDLYEMGLLTHLVLENPHFMLCDALGHSIGSVSQAYQQLPSHPETLKELLDTMHVCDDEWLEDPMDDPYWDKFMLIKTDRISMEKMKYHKSDIENFYDEIAACFNAPSLDEAVNRVLTAAPENVIVPAPFGAEEQNDYHWASQALLSLESCDPLAAKAWYKLTEISANPKMSLKEALQLEMHVNLGLMKGRLARMAALPTVNRDGSSFAKAEVHGSIAARLATVSAAEVDEIFENSPVSIPKKKM